MSLNGLILFNRQINGPDYISIIIKNGLVQFQYNLGTGSVSIESTSQLVLGEWNTIEAARSGPNGQLKVNSAVPVSSSSPGSSTQLQLGDNLYIGGFDNYSSLPLSVNVSSGFVGCIRDVRAGSLGINLNETITGRGIVNCSDFDSCLRLPCLNSGVCIDDRKNSFSCQCPSDWVGNRCDVKITPCAKNPCQNGGTCYMRMENGSSVQFCRCSLPYGGELCANSKLCFCATKILLCYMTHRTKL